MNTAAEVIEECGGFAPPDGKAGNDLHPETNWSSELHKRGNFFRKHEHGTCMKSSIPAAVCGVNMPHPGLMC